MASQLQALNETPSDQSDISEQPLAQAPPAKTILAKNPVVTLSSMLKDDLSCVEDLLSLNTSSSVKIIPDLSLYLIDAGGKRLRPMLTLAVAEACGGGGKATQSLAAAVEYIHSATLLHDDVVDDSALRRGKPTARKIWSNPAAVLVGDFLFARAFELMVETGNLDILGILSRTSAIIAEGEVRQLSAIGKLDLGEDDYFAIIKAKTAALFEAATHSGAVSAGADKETCEAYRLYGHYLGLSFQIIDDTLDYAGSADKIGKGVGDDFHECKITLPIVYAYQSALRAGDRRQLEFWQRAFDPAAQTEEDLETAISYLHSTGALQRSLDLAIEYSEKAKAEIAGLEASTYNDLLQGLADYCVRRDQ